MLTNTKPPAEMGDDELEHHIHDAGHLMELEMDRGNREAAQGWLQAMQEAVKSRSPAQVAKMEAERGLAPCFFVEQGLKTARQLLKKHGLQRVLDAIETAGETYVKVDPETEKGTPESVEKAWSKVGGVCALSSMPDDERRLYYVKAILRNRLTYVPYDVIDDLRSALKAGVAVELMEREAKNCRNWNAFSNWLMGLV